MPIYQPSHDWHWAFTTTGCHPVSDWIWREEAAWVFCCWEHEHSVEGLPTVRAARLHQRSAWSMPPCWQNWPLCYLHRRFISNVPQTQAPSMDRREWRQRLMGVRSFCGTVWHSTWRSINFGILGMVVPISSVWFRSRTFHRYITDWIGRIRNRSALLGGLVAAELQQCGTHGLCERLSLNWWSGIRPMWVHHQRHAILQFESSLPDITCRTPWPTLTCWARSQSHGRSF